MKSELLREMELIRKLELRVNTIEKRLEFCRYAINDMQKEGVWVRGLLVKPRLGE